MKQMLHLQILEYLAITQIDLARGVTPESPVLVYDFGAGYASAPTINASM